MPPPVPPVPLIPVPPLPPLPAPPVPDVPVPPVPPAGASASARLLRQKSNGTGAVFEPGTSTIADAIGSRLYATPVLSQHFVRRRSHGMNPPEPVSSVHHSVPPLVDDLI